MILGVFTEMLRRAVAASWTFYASSEPPVYLLIKPYFSLEDDALRLNPIPKPLTRASIASHHSGDYYMGNVWTPAKFPYAFQVVQAGYTRVMRADEYRLLTDSFWSATHPSKSGALARRLIDRLVQTAEDRVSRVVIVLMPHVDRLFAQTPHYDNFVQDLNRRGDICVIETKSVLREQARLLGPSSLAAPNRHYNPLGNRLIAEEVAAGLSRCNLLQ